MKSKLFLAVVNCITFFSILLTGCPSRDPGFWEVIDENFNNVTAIADFEADKNLGKFPLTVNFEDHSKGNILLRNWDFENDGSIDSHEVNPQWIYTRPGLYSVSLQIEVKTGKRDLKILNNYISVAESIEEQVVCDRSSKIVTRWPYSIYPADIDNDGRQDIVGVKNFYQGVVWWPNRMASGDGWGDPISISAMQDGVGLVLPYDVDGDGDTDIVGVSFAREQDISIYYKYLLAFQANFMGLDLREVINTYIVWWENVSPSHPDWPKHVISDKVFFYPHNLSKADVDGDGDLDVLSVTRYQRAEIIGMMSYELGSVNGNADALPSDTPYVVEDKTGRLNLVCWFENRVKEGAGWVEHIIDNSGSKPSHVDTADFNGDGRLDVVVSQEGNKELLWYTNTEEAAGGGIVWEKHTVTTGYENLYEVYPADFDGDGDADIISSAFDREEVYLWRNADGQGTTWNQEVVSRGLKTPQSLNSFDLDEDGDQDILVTTLIHGNLICWLENLGNWADDSGHWEIHILNHNSESGGTILPADLNNDGHPDVVGSSMENSKISWWDLYAAGMGRR